MSFLDTMGAVGNIAGSAARGYEKAKFGRFGKQDDQDQAPGPGPVNLTMQYLQNRNVGARPTRPFDSDAAYAAAARNTMPDVGAAPPPQPVPGMAPITSQAMPQPPQGMYPPRGPYDPNSTAAGAQRFASGGVVNRPTTALIGEDGPEMVVPLTNRPDARVSRANLLGMRYRR